MQVRVFIVATVLALPTATHAAEPWTLKSALDYALRHNPEARLAGHRITGAEAMLGQATAAFMPHIALQSGYTRTSNPMLVFGAILNQKSFSGTLDFNDVPDTDDANVKGLVTIPLYTGGANLAGLRAARANRAAARIDSETVRNELGFEVARAFYTVLKTREFVRATEAGVRAFEKNLAVARDRMEEGTLLRTDVLDVEVRLARAREDLVRARNAAALAERALRNLLGIDKGEFAVADCAPAVEPPQTRDYSKRPELRAATERVRAAEAAARRAESGYLPRVNAFGSVDYDHGWKFDNGAWSYTAGVMMQWDLWDGNLTRARVGEARAALDTAREQRRKVRLAIDLETERAGIRLREARERLAVTEKVVARAAESAELTRSLFEQGLAISTQLIDAEAALVAARVRRAEAEADRRIAVAALRKALGLPQLPNTEGTT